MEGISKDWISKEYIRKYLDRAINFWREQREGGKENSQIYVNCFQSVRREFIGDVLEWPEPDNTPKMIRPEWAVLVKNTPEGYLQCNCGSTLQAQQAVREHWQEGHFDYVAEEPSQWDIVAKEEMLEKYSRVFAELSRIDRIDREGQE